MVPAKKSIGEEGEFIGYIPLGVHREKGGIDRCILEISADRAIIKVENCRAMKYQYGQVIFWALLLFVAFMELKTLLLRGVDAFLADWTGLEEVVLSLSSLTVFLLFSLGSYSGLYFSRDRSMYLRVGLISASVILVMGLRYLLEEVIFLYWLGFDNYYDTVTSVGYFWDNLYYALVFSSVGIIYYFIQRVNLKERVSRELALQHKSTELAFLRSQMNPHFLFNTLNNIYTLVYQQSEKALPAMDKLTSLLRYALYEPEEQVPLSKELKYINDFVELQKLRYDYPIQINFRVEVDSNLYCIPPFLLIPFVENAFKHGDLKDPVNPVGIVLERTPKGLVFRVLNRKRRQEKDRAGGIGLENVRKRLELLYPDQHELEIKDRSDRFEVILLIPFRHCWVEEGQPIRSVN